MGSHVIAINEQANLATYFAFGQAYAGYATPTDLLTISGSASKTIRIINMNIRIGTTSAALQKVHFIKRTAANTGGTSAAQTAIKFDGESPDASAVVKLYSVIPDALGSGITVAVAPLVTAVLTAAPAQFSLVGHLRESSATSLTTALTLRGASEFLCANWDGAALPAGFLAQWEILWTESAK